MSKVVVRLMSAMLLIAALTFASPALAVHPEERAEIENLRQRIEAIEAGKEKPEAPLLIEALAKKLRFSGLLELEGTYAKIKGGDDASDLALATAQLEVEGSLNDNIAGHIVLLHEEGADESIVVDEAVISLGCSVTSCPGKLSFAGGKMYLPFGKFNSHLVTDPLTLDLGETNDTAVYLGWALADRVDLKLGVFAGGTDTAGDDDSIDSFVGSVEANPLEGLTLGASYISDLAESELGLVADTSVYNSSVPGGALFISAAAGRFTLEGEYVTALQRFDQALVDASLADPEHGILTGRRPSAWNVELALAPNDRWEIAARVEKAKDFLNDVLRYGGVVSYGLFQNTVVALEYLYADEQEGSELQTHLVTAQLAFEF